MAYRGLSVAFVSHESPPFTVTSMDMRSRRCPEVSEANQDRLCIRYIIDDIGKLTLAVGDYVRLYTIAVFSKRGLN